MQKKQDLYMREEKKGGKFFNGLLWGAALGGGAAYLLSNKRGRDLLKDLLHDGVDLLEKDLAPKKKAIEKVLAPEMHEEAIIESAPQDSESEEQTSADKKRFFKKATKK